MIKGCTLIEEIQVLEWLFELDERQKQAAFTQRLVIRVNELVRELAQQEKRGPEILPQLIVGWSGEERLCFQNDWNDDSFLADLEVRTTHDVLSQTNSRQVGRREAFF